MQLILHVHNSILFIKNMNVKKFLLHEDGFNQQ